MKKYQPNIEQALDAAHYEVKYFEREDWLRLAMAALDQAGMSKRGQERVALAIKNEIGPYDFVDTPEPAPAPERDSVLASMYDDDGEPKPGVTS